MHADFCPRDGERLQGGKCTKCGDDIVAIFSPYEDFSTKYCIVDGSVIPSDSEFCPTCGHEQPEFFVYGGLRQCTNDKRMIPESFAYCPFCGERQLTYPSDVSQSFQDLSPERIEAVLSFLPFFEKGDRKDFYRIENSSIDYSDRVDAFNWAMLNSGIYYLFDWQRWIKQVGWNRAIEPEFILGADLLTIKNLVTAIYRDSRFSEGTLADMIDNGVILLILKRLERLYLESKKTAV